MQVLPGYSANAMARPTSSVPPLHVDLAEQARAAITQHHRVRSCRAWGARDTGWRTGAVFHAIWHI